MNQSQSLEAIVLRRWDTGEKDQIISFLSREKGRLQGIAKGAKVSLKRFGPALDLFSWIRLQVKERKNTSLLYIEQAQVISNFPQLRQNYASILIASGLLELSHHLFKEGLAEEAAFFNLLESLKKLEEQGAQRRVFWSFLLKNFEILGWGLHLQTCFKCGKSLTEDFHFFDVEQGGGVCETCRASSRKVFSLSLSLLEWMNNPSQEKGISPEEEALLQELLEKQYIHHLHLLPDWNRFLRL